METWLFVLVSVGIIVVPGPNVLVIISTSITYGKLRGLQTVAGTSTAMLLQLVVAALGTSYLISALAKGFIWLKWAGAFYLLYLGVKHLILAFRGHRQEITASAIGSFQRGFWVSLTNPKTILFFSAFLPQFVVESTPYLPQIMILSILFWLIAVALDSTYAILSSKLIVLLSSKNLVSYQNGLSGLAYLTAGSLLANTKNV